MGLILGTLLFILYVNDIAMVSNKCSMVFFADDTNIFFTGNNDNQLESLVCEGLNKFNFLFYCWRTIPQCWKYKYMVFNSTIPNYNIMMDVKTVCRVDSINKKNCCIDRFTSDFGWSHFLHLKSQYFKGLVNIQVEIQPPRKILITIFLSSVYSHLSYCSTSTGIVTPAWNYCVLFRTEYHLS